MTDKQDGGPAFPQKRIYRCSQSIDHELHETGMSLRDWFAGQALAGILSNPNIENAYFKIDAGLAYDAADAMLAARTGGDA